MKKIIAILLVLVLAATGVFAASLVQIGATGRYIAADLTEVEGFKDFSKYSYGVDARVNFGSIGVGANALYSGDFVESHRFDTFATVNYRMDIAILQLSLGAGVNVNIGNVNDDGTVAEKWTINGEDFSETFEVIKGSTVFANIGAGLNLGGIGVAVDYKIPFDTAYKYITDKTDDIETLNKGSVSVSLLLNLL